MTDSDFEIVEILTRVYLDSDGNIDQLSLLVRVEKALDDREQKNAE